MVLVPQRRCWVTMVSTDVAEVSRKVPIAGGMCRAMSAIASSEITPGPLGMAETSPTAEAPQEIAARASASEAMQQILIRGIVLTGDARNRLTTQRPGPGDA